MRNKKTNKNKRVMTIILALSMMTFLLITGCSKFFGGRGQDIPTYDFREGTQGISMSIMRGMPPDSMYSGTDFSLGIKVKNMGAYNIVDRAEMKISVPDAEAFKFTDSNTKYFMLEGKSQYLKEGQEDVLTFPMKSVCIPYGSFRKNYTAKLQAMACYYYETTAQQDICIDTLYYKRQKGDKKECDMRAYTLSGGQGGPVGVWSISQPQIIETGEKTKVEISINIKKFAGKGVSVFNPNVACDDVTKINEAEIEVSLGGKKLTCKPAKTMKLKEKGSGIICSTYVDKNAGAYTTPLVIKMKYYILQKLIKEIKIQPPPGGREAADCQNMIGTGTKGEGKCSSTFEGYSCKDVSAECPTGDASCIEGLGCKVGYCPGGKTNVCCPG